MLSLFEDELKDLKLSCDFMNNRVDDFTVTDMENREIEMEQLQVRHALT